MEVYVTKIANHPTDDIHTTFDHEILKHSFQFYSDMLNRAWFVLVVIGQVITVFLTIYPAWAQYHQTLDELTAHE